MDDVHQLRRGLQRDIGSREESVATRQSSYAIPFTVLLAGIISVAAYTHFVPKQVKPDDDPLFQPF